MNKTYLSVCALSTLLMLSACGGEQKDAANAAQNNDATQTAAVASPEDQVSERQKSMKAIAKANRTLKEMLEGKTAFDAAAMQEAAATLNTHANAGWERYDAATKAVESSALPAVWEKNDQFQQEIKTFQASVGELNTAAAQGTLDAIKAPVAKVGESCKSCHTAFKAKND